MPEFSTIIKKSLKLKLLACVLFVSGVVTCFISGYQLYWDYSSDVKGVKTRLSQVESSFVIPVQDALWELNNALLESSLNGIIKLADISYTAILDEDGKLLVSKGIDKGGAFVKKKISLYHKEADSKYFLGTLVTVGSLNEARQRLKDRMFIVIFSQALKTFITSFLILLIAQILVTRHLTNMYSFFKTDNKKENELIELDKSYLIGTLKNRDEIDILTDAINGMVLKTQDELSKRIEAEGKLASKNEKLVSKLLQQREAIFEDKKVSIIGTTIRNVLSRIHNPQIKIEEGFVDMMDLLRKNDFDKEEMFELISKTVEFNNEINKVISEAETLANKSQRDNYKELNIMDIVSETIEFVRAKHVNKETFLSIDAQIEQVKLLCEKEQILLLFTTLIEKLYQVTSDSKDSWIKIGIKSDAVAISVSFFSSSHSEVCSFIDKDLGYINLILHNHNADILVGSSKDTYDYKISFRKMM